MRFRVAGSTFRAADLTHWLALDVAAQALADAGFPDGEGLPREATGVLVGNTPDRRVLPRQPAARCAGRTCAAWSATSLRQEGLGGRARSPISSADLEERYKAPFPAPNEESLAGGLSNTIAGRICNHFDLHGGGYTVDGACASSLLAVAQACSALAAGDLDVALAGGVDLSLDPFELVGFARTGALAPDEMRVYDARSAGFLPGEGCGFVVLMREEDAVRLGCRIYAVIRGWGISSDGHGGISRPEAEGQRLAFDRAYRRAGFGIETVGYFEGHGTGTAVGDATELQGSRLGARRPGARRRRRAPIGSIKANIGHTKAAAGRRRPDQGDDGPAHPGAAAEHRLRRAASRARRPARAAARPAARARPGRRTGRCAPRRAPWASAASTPTSCSRARPQRAAARSPRPSAPCSPPPRTPSCCSSPPRTRPRSRPRWSRLLAIAPRISRSELTDLAAELHDRLEGGAARAAVVAATPAELAERLDRLRGWLAEGIETRLEPKQGIFLALRGQPRRIGFLFPGQGSRPTFWRRAAPALRGPGSPVRAGGHRQTPATLSIRPWRSRRS